MNEVEMTAGGWYFQRAKLDAKEEWDLGIGGWANMPVPAFNRDQWLL